MALPICVETVKALKNELIMIEMAKKAMRPLILLATFREIIL